MRLKREHVAVRYLDELGNLEEMELPPVDPNRIHAWHLFPIRLRLDKLAIDRNAFIEDLKSEGIGLSVHWRPLHLHPYYEQTFGWRAEDFPAATNLWPRLVSLPIFPDMQEQEIDQVVRVIRKICADQRRVTYAVPVNGKRAAA